MSVFRRAQTAFDVIQAQLPPIAWRAMAARLDAARLLGLLGVRLVVLGFGLAGALLVALLLVVRQALPDVGDLLAHLPHAAREHVGSSRPTYLHAQMLTSSRTSAQEL